MKDPLFSAWHDATLVRTEQALEAALPSSQQAPQRLHQAMRYAVLGGGKRVRALLVYAAGTVFNAAPELLDAAAVAVECIHCYSLVHDDLPDMDNDQLRRGKPTVWVAFDRATALLTGDALQALAFEALAAAPEHKNSLLMLHELAHASGSLGMAGGQAIDLESVGKPLSAAELEHMHRLKTGALLRASVRLGALAGGANLAQLHIIDRYANALGLAFQVVDDVLDAQADTATLGKTAGKDAAADKPTYVSLLGLDEAQKLAAQLGEQAQRALQDLMRVGNTHHLSVLANLVVERTH